MFDDLDQKNTAQKPVEDMFNGVDTAPATPSLRPASPLPPAPVSPALASPAPAPRPLSGNGQKNIWKTAIIILAILIVLTLLAIGGRFLYLKLSEKNNLNEAAANTPAALNTEPAVNSNINQPAINANAAGGLNENANVNGGNVAPLDSDADGLPDAEEAALGADSQNADTDTDGLLDGEEVKIYKTDPKNADTDGDGYKDGQEVKGGYNPLGPGRLFDVKP